MFQKNVNSKCRNSLKFYFCCFLILSFQVLKSHSLQKKSRLKIKHRILLLKFEIIRTRIGQNHERISSCLKQPLHLLCYCGPDSWGHRIHRQHFYSGVIPPTSVLIYDTKQDLVSYISFSTAGALGNAEYPFIASALRSTLMVAHDRLLSMSQI